jgi:hypothetical protein
MTRRDWQPPPRGHWAVGIILAIVLQVLAFTFWAGRLQGTVNALIGNVDALRHDLSAHTLPQ